MNIIIAEPSALAEALRFASQTGDIVFLRGQEELALAWAAQAGTGSLLDMLRWQPQGDGLLAACVEAP